MVSASQSAGSRKTTIDRSTSSQPSPPQVPHPGEGRLSTRLSQLKDPPGKVLLTLLAVLMTAGAAASLWAAGTRTDPIWQSFWSGIATTCIGIFGTVFLVDQLLKRVERQRRFALDLHVRQRVSRIAFHETDMMLAMMQDDAAGETRPHSTRDKDGINRIPDGFVAWVEGEINGVEGWLITIDARRWTAFGRTFNRMALEYSRLISLFGYEMDVEVLRLMLRVEESAHRLAGLVADQESLLGNESEARDDAAPPIGAETIAIMKFHVERIMSVNLEILRKV
jgi:hypothetical protein